MKSFALNLVFGIFLLSQSACYTGINFDVNQEANRSDSTSWFNVLQLNPNTPVVVTLKDGRQIKGKVKMKTSEVVTLLTSANQEKMVERSNVYKIEKLKKDGLKEGLLIGVACGALAWVGYELIKSADNDQTEPQNNNGERDYNVYIPDLNPYDGADPTKTLYLFSTIGAGIGVLFDLAAQQKILLFQAAAEAVK